MITSTDEIERPTEWLRSLQEGRRDYHWLLCDAGSLALAAYRLACARCRVQPVPTRIPTARELYAAARTIARFVGHRDIPQPALLVADCNFAGLPVIAPLAQHAA